MVWLLILVLIAGFTKLATCVVNRCLSIPQPKWMIAVSQLIQFLLIALYLIYCMLHFGARDWADLFDLSSSKAHGVIELSVMATGLVGFITLIGSIIGYQRYRPPRCEIQNDSQLIDFRQSPQEQPWNERLVGARPMRRIALLPGNEQFKLEVSTKTYELPRLPPEWDGLSVVHFSDTHFRGGVTRRYFELVSEQIAALQPDLIAFTGDLLDDLALLNWLPETFGHLKAPLGQYFILGNHDWYRGANEIRQEFIRLGWTDISGRTQQIQCDRSGPPIVIGGDESPWIGQHPQIPAETRDLFQILLSHTPDNIAWAREQGIGLMLAGHTHGGQIRLPLLGPVFSPSRYGCRYASGVFWLEPTLLYVSRGISGCEPVRYLCTPELTRIVLKSKSGVIAAPAGGEAKN